MDRTNITFTAGTLQQLLATSAERLLADAAGPGGIVSATGRLGKLGAARGQWFYGVPLADDGGTVLVDVPLGLAGGLRLSPGDPVMVTGAVTVKAGRPGLLDVRIAASRIEILRPLGAPAEIEASRPGVISIEQMKQLNVARRAFPMPQRRPLSVVLIHSNSLRAQVYDDCRSELDKLQKMIQVQAVPTNMTQPASIASAIEKAAGDVVMLIRGGGDEREFDVFDHPDVVEALARNQGYRVVGLGHSGNRTVLDIVADFSANTPAQAGLHVREEVERRVREWQERSFMMKVLTEREQGGTSAAPKAETKAAVAWKAWVPALIGAGLFIASVALWLSGKI